jgi:iron complex outermembrane receptor protein
MFNVSNVFDKEPPFARVEINYDATTASALGRTFKFSIAKQF